MRLIKLLIAVAFCLILSVAAFAHPGGTDSSGGHRNHSTGEYHYHHGYSAHQHTDMDGDGVLDCPYKFKDKTGSSSGSSSSSKSSTKSPTTPTIKEESSSEKTDSSKKSKTFFDYVQEFGVWLWNLLLFLMDLFFALSCLLVVIDILSRIIKWIFRR